MLQRLVELSITLALPEPIVTILDGLSKQSLVHCREYIEAMVSALPTILPTMLPTLAVSCGRGGVG